MKIDFRRELRQCKLRIEHRLRDREWSAQAEPMMAGKNIHYEMSSRDRGIAIGGIGAMHLLSQRLGVAKAIDSRLHLLKVHLPYSESDHVLNFAYNALAGGSCIEDVELLRNNEGYRDASAEHQPDRIYGESQGHSRHTSCGPEEAERKSSCGAGGEAC